VTSFPEAAGAAAGRWTAQRMHASRLLRPLACWIGLRNLETRGLLVHQPDGSVIFRHDGEERVLTAAEWELMMKAMRTR
jgi:hypothetical protein